jgi:hypothetical protein
MENENLAKIKLLLGRIENRQYNRLSVPDGHSSFDHRANSADTCRKVLAVNIGESAESNGPFFTPVRRTFSNAA